ncbi:MAG: hypothetical protein GXO62_07250 [Epsilonproteobacteria bacterium]|nr:hypothetical protein [Campylobacterota bacterium]
MKHIEFLNLLCKHRKIINQAYIEKKVISIPPELAEIGLFDKIGGYYYLNEAYYKFVDTILQRVDFTYVIEDFDKELKKLKEAKKEYMLSKNPYFKEQIFTLTNRIYQGMKNRDKNLLSLIEKLENDLVSDLDILIKEAKNILSSIEESMQKNEEIIEVIESLKSEFRDYINDVLFNILILNQNIDTHLKRIREFISQSEKKRLFNQKLFNIAHLILNEDKRIDEYLGLKRFAFKKKIEYVPDTTYIRYSKLKSILGNIGEKNTKKPPKVRKLEEVIELIDLKGLIKFIKGSPDIFKSIIEYVGEIDRELLNESVRVFVYILNHYDKELVYTKEYNEFNIRIVKWRV